MLLHDGWVLHRDADNSLYPAIVPGNVHTDLLREGAIRDPFHGNNEKEVQWVGEETWTYESSFFVPRSILEKEVVILCFEGLDTYAEIYLNGSLAGVTDNMFRTYRYDVKKLLVDDSNHLKIRFSPAEQVCSAREANHPYPLPDKRGFLRKAPYQFGWDWGPKLVTCGIWKPVTLEGWDKVRILSSYISTEVVGEDGTAIMRCLVELESTGESGTELKFDFGPGPGGLERISKKTRVLPGENIVSFDFRIEDARLWDCDDPFLYDYGLTVFVEGQKYDHRSGRFGVRTIELITASDEHGKSFFFQLNGKPVFMKGANIIPLDNFPARVPGERYEDIIRMASEANMNMLRVWGGGIYEDDRFYDLCDEKGILVWQDFMYACNLYPGTDEFLEGARLEAVDQVRRLRGHPSVALWCGNNEIAEGWHNWGWQKQLGYSEEDSVNAWEAYQALFERVLPDVVRMHDGHRSYWPSSPQHGWGREESLAEGDMHYWGVWWGEEPFSRYEEKVGRFMSEYGFQGFPAQGTLDDILLPEDRHLDSEALRNHQKHPRGMHLIRTYMERDYNVPDTYNDYIYVSQLLQAEGAKTAIEAHRRSKPRCMGTLFWQLNDCWPAISWSAIDYPGHPKALYYFARKAYADILLSFEHKDDSVWLHAVSDKDEKVRGRLVLRMLDFYGKTLYEESQDTELDAGSAGIVLRRPSGSLMKENDPARVMLLAEFMHDASQPARAVMYLLAPKDLDLPGPEPEWQVTAAEHGYLFELRSPVLVKNVFLDLPGHDGYFEDNFFDLLPGRPITVKYVTRSTDPLPALEWKAIR